MTDVETSFPWVPTLRYLGVFCLVSLFVYSQVAWPAIKRNGKPLPKPPNTLPLVGNGILFLRDRQKLFDWFTKCERLFGHETFQISVPSLPPGVVINAPMNLEYVFRNDGTLFGKGDFFKNNSWDLFGNGIITADGELWKAQRKAGASFLSTANMRVLTEVALPMYLGQSVNYMKKAQDVHRVVDLQHVFHEITSQVMGKMAYNVHDIHADDPFTKAFDYGSEITANRFQNPLWSITELFTGSRFRKSLAVVRAFGEKIVRSAVKDRDQEIVADESKLDEVSGTLIQSLLDALKDEKIVADAALNYLSAGRDTVAQALTWTFMLLLKPENKLSIRNIREEIAIALSKDPAAHDGDSEDAASRAATLLTSVNLPYTMAVFYESLRLYPPIPFEIKQCEKKCTLPDGTLLPAKSIIVWCPWAMNRSYITWGNTADSFQPQRWLVDGKLVSKSATEFPVFNGGTRSCLGKKMAEAMAAQVIATMVSKFDLSPAYRTERVSKSSLTLPMDGGLPCRVTAL